MKIDLTSLFFNVTVNSPGNTASWGTALGQQRPNYPITVNGAVELIDALDDPAFKIEFNPIQNTDHLADLRHLESKTILHAGLFKCVYVNSHKIEVPFVMLVVREDAGYHNGRQSLKYNYGIVYGDIKNSDFYLAVQNFFGESASWFAFDISIENRNELHIKAIKLSNSATHYDDANRRRIEWKQLVTKYPNGTSQNVLDGLSETYNYTQIDYLIWNCVKTKPFIILAGISGTGKSRLVRKLAFEFCTEELKDEAKKKPGNFELVKVRPNWHDSTELLGYESRISGSDRYIFTDFVRFIVKAMHYPEVPFFLCLDEMNIAPVEQYFAEYLSVLETRKLNNDGVIVSDALIGASVFRKYTEKESSVDENFDLRSELQIERDDVFEKLISEGLTLPPNLIVMGTVNMDETTHTFSRKVLDRAMTIEMTIGDLIEGLGDEDEAWKYPDVPLNGELIIPGKTDGWQVSEELGEFTKQIVDYLKAVNTVVAGSPFAIAYRVRDEFLIYAFNYMEQNGNDDDWLKNVLDEMTLMKILPRIEGDEEKTSVLESMIKLFGERKLGKSLAKAVEMNERRKSNHFTSFWP